MLIALQLTQPYPFKRYDTSSGLSNNIIHDIFQDSDSFLWIATENGLNRFDGHNFTTFSSNSSDSTSISHNVVMDIFEDNEQNLWVGTWNGLNLFDRITETFIHHTSMPSLGDYRIGFNDLLIDQDGIFWFPVTSGICLFNPQNKTFELIQQDVFGSDRFMEAGLYKLFKDMENNIWVFNRSVNYLGKFDIVQKKLVPLAIENDLAFHVSFNTGNIWIDSKAESPLPFLSAKNLPELPPGIKVEKLLEDQKGNLWIGTDNGIFLQQTETDNAVNISGSKLGTGSLSYYVEQIYEDRWGGIWIGTRNGLFHFDPFKKPFKNIDLKTTNTKTAEQISNLVMSIEPDETGLWMGTLGSGIHWYDLEKKINFQYNIDSKNQSQANQVWDVFRHLSLKNTLWVATTNGLYSYQTNTEQSERISLPLTSQANPIIFSITLGSSNSIWIAGDQDVYELDISTKRVIQKPDFLPEMSVSTVQDLLVKENYLYISTQGTGLLLYNLEKKQFEPPLKNSSSLSVLTQFPIWDIHEDLEENLWLATGGGLFRLNTYDNTLNRIYSSTLETNPVFFSIIEDNASNLWLGSDDGLYKFTIKDTLFVKYDHTNGLANSEFNRRATAITTDGEFWFGGTNGISHFKPSEISANSFTPIPHINSFTLFDSKGATPVLYKDKDAIDFNWYDNTFEIGFSGITFTNPEHVKYRYMLEKHDPVWVYADQKTFARYSKIPPGKYTFRVFTSNSDGIWNASALELPITIHPPFWKTWWAYIAYLTLFVFGIISFIRWRTRSLEKDRTRLEQKVSERTKELEEQKELAVEAKRKIEVQAKQLKELDEMKSRFFANISHELRTPLTLIDAPLQQILAENLMTFPIEKLETKLQGIQRNSHRLAKLIDELLDLSRLKENSIELTLKQTNLQTWFALFIDSYQSLAQAKGISFRTRQEIGDVKHVKLDVEKFDKITSNLVNNALKFTRVGDYIEIALAVEKNILTFTVTDSGIGISDTELPKIFDRFYKGTQIDNDLANGLGLGLSLSKELAEVMDGYVNATSTLGEGSTFYLCVPIITDYKNPEPIEDISKPKRLKKITQKTVLIVEDNHEMRKFISQLLESDFEIFEAKNGIQALHKLKSISPNLIISDLMMPEMDGLELTQKLRSIPNYAHIPILMLTARATDEDRLYSLRIGVDDYLSKPFSPEEVRVRSVNLADNHIKRLTLNSEAEKSEVPPHEKELLEIQKTIEEQMSNTSLTVLKLASDLHTSERQLYRKVQQLTGMTPNEYINSIRLNYARKLLISNRSVTIEMVAQKVGFKSRSYFSRLFKKAYGISPGKFQSQK